MELYGLSDIPTTFQQKTDGTLNSHLISWLDDIIAVTEGKKEKHRAILFTKLDKLPDAGFRVNEKKSEFVLRETIGLGHEIKKL